ncbi:NAD kinase [Corynebacterium sputi]|uniref:NAD kinase n=1 Tax=Corynebacterium sputi TaxID=489915 RepID=UPI0004799954|nr:NAD kinase [Corynebacterium sputi]
MTDRRVLLVPHTGRRPNLAAAAEAARLLEDSGIEVRVLAGDRPESLIKHPVLGSFPRFGHSTEAAEGCELILVLGGDGTFLRAADIAHANDLPVLGINMGHVGFLAEWEQDSMTEAITRVIDRSWRVEDRMTLEITVTDVDGKLIGDGWALNELSLENLNRRGVLDVVLEVDERPVSSYGCDGVLVSTPTGSTAYAFSAGGPVLWPELDAMLVVPNNAHALFDRPLVVSPFSSIAVETGATTTPAEAILDGFKRLQVPPGSRVEVKRGPQPVRWVRLDEVPFADRLVHKFRLPVTGWRGPRK